VIHSHGFYCRPCWGLHSTVLEDAEYREFSRKNVVEVLCLSGLEDGMARGDAKAATYEGTRRGRPARFLAKFPGLTPAEAVSMNAGRAGAYNDTGLVPATIVVDPHSGAALHRWVGRTTGCAIQQVVADARRGLEQAHGKGCCPDAFGRFLAEEEKAWGGAARGEYARAIRDLDAAAAAARDWPQGLQARCAALRAEILASAEARLQEIATRSSNDPRRAKADLTQMVTALAGTDLEARARTLLAQL
jgi:hypothetical protein